MKHCIYKRSYSFMGWLIWGWYLVKIFDEEWIVPNVREIIRGEGAEKYLAVYEMEPPLVWRFWFTPGKGRRVA